VHLRNKWLRQHSIQVGAAAVALVMIGVMVLFLRTPWHDDIITTFENGGAPEQSAADMGISNVPSAWYTDWPKHLCGADMDGSRALHAPDCDNMFYFALPCPDFDESGQIAANIKQSGWKVESEQESAFKNKWIQVEYGDKSVYLQWEDVGPLAPTSKGDCDYVFGDNRPAQEKGLKDGVNNDDDPSNDVPNSALDISPQAFMYLTGQTFAQVYDQGQIKTSWRFVDAEDVPDGPWKINVTVSPPDW
jgi:hypothetical protein